MRTVQKVESNLDDFFIEHYTENDVFKLDTMSNKEAAEITGVSPEVIKLLKDNFSFLVDLLKLDLKDIWKQIER